MKALFRKILIVGLIVSIVSVALAMFIENEKVLICSVCIGSLCAEILGVLSLHNDFRKYNIGEDEDE